MNKITFSQNDCKEETTSIWLISVMQCGLKLEFFKPLENFKLKMKEVKFTELETVGVRVLVKKVGTIKGFVRRTIDKIEVNIP